MFLINRNFKHQMKHRMEKAQRLLCSEPDRNQLYHAGATGEVPSGGERRGCRPTQTPSEKERRKLANIRYTAKRKDKHDKLMEIACRLAGVEKRELSLDDLNYLLRIVPEFPGHEFCKFLEMKFEFGGIEKMQSKLRKFDQLISMFEGIDDSVPQINRLKNMEFQNIKCEQMGSCLNHQNAQPPVADFLQQQDDHGMRSANFNKQVQGDRIDRLGFEINERVPAAKGVAIPYLVCSHATEYSAIPDENVMSNMHISGFNEMLPAVKYGTEFVTEVNEPVMSNMCLSGFNRLHGECLTVGENSSTQYLASIWHEIMSDDNRHDTQIDERILEKTIESFRAVL